MGPQLPPLSAAQLETLLACLDPQLQGFGGMDGWLADARAYLERLGGEGAPDPSLASLHVWLDAWGQADGNRETLRLAVQVLQQQLQA